LKPIVGRDVELLAVDRFLDRVEREPAALAIEGEAGIGKTTVWAEAVRAAKGRGFRVLEARPAENEAKLSYSTLADLAGAAFDEVRTTLPLPQERALSVALLRDEATGAAEPRTTATGLVGVLTALAAGGPTLVAIDDVQWLDAASEQALAFAARRLPSRLGLLLARRTEEDDVELPLDLARALRAGQPPRPATGRPPSQRRRAAHPHAATWQSPGTVAEAALPQQRVHLRPAARGARRGRAHPRGAGGGRAERGRD